MKLFKLFSPISIVILAIALFAVFGTGCMEIPADQAGLADAVGNNDEKSNSIPMLDILQPDLTTSTTSGTMLIKGETDQQKVYVANKVIDVSNGKFEANVDLKKGLNIMSVEAGNGITTTTISLQITKN